MIDLDLDVLERLADAATLVPQWAQPSRTYRRAFSPPTVKALIARIRELETMLAEEADRACSHEPNWNPEDPTYGHCERCGVGLARCADGEVEVR